MGYVYLVEKGGMGRGTMAIFKYPSGDHHVQKEASCVVVR